MRILVAQMTRMGDVLQTSPLIRALRMRYPDAHIAAMVRRMGRAIAERNPDIDQVIVYEEDSMYVHLRADDSDRLLEAYRMAEAYIDEVRAGQFDVAYNCTHSVGSAMLLKAAGIPEVVGAHMTGDWLFTLRGAGTTYFFASVLHREYNDLNLCDLFRHFMTHPPPAQALAFEVRDEDRAATAELLAQNGVSPDDFVVCMQLGASDMAKRWPTEHFAQLARHLVDGHKAKIVLVGVESEAACGRAFEEYVPGLATQLYGQTTIPQLAALLERSKVLITNDTGTMHIAAAVRCPIVLVSVGYVHFRETGPYGVGHVAIEKRREALGQSIIMREAGEEAAHIQPDQAYQAVEAVLSAHVSGASPSLMDAPSLTSVDVFASRFAPDGCLQWYPLLRRPLTERDYLRIAFRAMWLAYLGGVETPKGEEASLREILRCHAAPPECTVVAWRQRHVTAFAELAGRADQGAAMTREVLRLIETKRPFRQAKEFVDRLMELDEQTRLFAETSEPCKPLVEVARFERDNLEGADPVALSQATLVIYEGLGQKARLMKAKLERAAEVWAKICR